MTAARSHQYDIPCYRLDTARSIGQGVVALRPGEMSKDPSFLYYEEPSDEAAAWWFQHRKEMYLASHKCDAKVWNYLYCF